MKTHLSRPKKGEGDNSFKLHSVRRGGSGGMLRRKWRSVLDSNSNMDASELRDLV